METSRVKIKIITLEALTPHQALSWTAIDIEEASS